MCQVELTGVSTSRAPGNWSGWYTRLFVSSALMLGSTVRRGLFKTRAHRGQRNSRETMSAVAVTRAADVAMAAAEGIASAAWLASVMVAVVVGGFR